MDPETRRYSRTLIDYELPHESIERLSQRKREEWQRIQSYVVHEDCLMQMLAGELDDSDAMPCGRCQNCAPEDALPKTFEHATGVAAGEFLVDICIEIAPKSWLARSRAAAEGLFPQYGFPFSLKAKKLQHESGRALCYWGEAGWGEIAMHGKHEGEFDPRLVGAAAKLIRERWSPDPFPEWLTFVPSHEHPELVPAFAEKLAATLGISCHDVVQKVKKNLPQKSRENTFHRCRNLDGVFEIHEPLPEGPTLLVDDAYDSGWTFAVIAALLRRAGSGPVIPFAIMSTSSA